MKSLGSQFQNLVRMVLGVGAALLFAACSGLGGFGDPTNKSDTLVVRSATDEVKWISSAVSDARDTISLQSASYRIFNEGRLLVRLSALKNSAPNIIQQQPILFRVQLAEGSDEALARSELKICSLEKNWMMLATWTKAHPYKAGAWKNLGGDFLPENCILPLPSNHASIATAGEAAFCGKEGTLCYDLQDWVQSYVRERGIDNGFILIYDSPTGLRIHGDATTAGPTVFWRKLRY